jgi:hypothetical protein
MEVYFRSKAVAVSFERHSALYRCENCGARYEVFPEEKLRPLEVSERQASEVFGLPDPEQ